MRVACKDGVKSVASGVTYLGIFPLLKGFRASRRKKKRRFVLSNMYSSRATGDPTCESIFRYNRITAVKQATQQLRVGSNTLQFRAHYGFGRRRSR
jgi:hypothetical protein